ncbi:MAG: hypothetical protein P1P90_04730 [Patescibacteria group bacterium]|nr:hypothetical protein [Patescibacteria group bacterium]
MQEQLKSAILRTLAFQTAWNYAPTRLQLFLFLDSAGQEIKLDSKELFAEMNTIVDELISKNILIEDANRITLKSHSQIIEEGRDNEIYFPRKLRNVRRAIKYLKLLPWVRSICLCNTTALGQARDNGDLDFFIICHAGTIWRTRFFATLPFKILNARPGERKVDPVCLSFFVTEDALNLSNLSLEMDDPYMRYWFLSLLPLTDDGILSLLWQENLELRRRHPNAQKWTALDKSPVPGTVTIKKDTGEQPTLLIERWLRQIQSVRFPKVLAEIANQDTRVIINDNVLKFHVTDNRKLYRDKYYNLCHDLNIQP